MRNDPLMNGGLIGFGVGFIAASLALYRVVSLVLPKYATQWQFKGVIVIGAVGLIAGIVLEVIQRAREKRKLEDNEKDEEKE